MLNLQQKSQQQKTNLSNSLQITFKPTPKQDQAWEILQDKTTNEILFGGGAGGGKTTLACAWLTISALLYPQTRWLIGRKELKRLKQSVLLTLFDIFSEWGLEPNKHYSYNASSGNVAFYTGSEFQLMDLDRLPSDPNYDRLGSVEYTGGFIEESAEVEQKAKEVVRSRIRYKLNEYDLIPKLLMTCNPSKNWLYSEYYRPFKEGKLAPDKAFIQSLVTDNPHISPHYIESLKNLKDRILRERLLNGNWEYEDSDNALFYYDALVDMASNTLEENNVQYISCDAARFGNDKAVIKRWIGLKVVEKKEFGKSATTLIEEELKKMAATHFIPMSRVIVDEEGVGGGIVDHLRCKGFVGGSSAIDRRLEFEKAVKTEYKINYKNLRAQCYHKLAELVNTHKIAIDIDDHEYKEKLIQELEQIRVINIDTDGKFQIIPKDEIKLAIGRSPDYADTMMMRMWFEVNPERAKAKVFAQKPAGF